VVLALDFAEAVAECLQEVVVCREDLAGRGEFDHRLGAGNGGELAGVFGSLQLCRGDVSRELHHLVGLVATEDGIVGGLDPDLLAGFGDALVLAGVETSGGE